MHCKQLHPSPPFIPPSNHHWPTLVALCYYTEILPNRESLRCTTRRTSLPQGTYCKVYFVSVAREAPLLCQASVSASEPRNFTIEFHILPKVWLLESPLRLPWWVYRDFVFVSLYIGPSVTFGSLRSWSWSCSNTTLELSENKDWLWPLIRSLRYYEILVKTFTLAFLGDWLFRRNRRLTLTIFICCCYCDPTF